MKAIIFDLDNTLIDFSVRKKRVIKKSVKAMIDAGLKEDYNKLLKDFSDYYWKTGIEDQKIFQKYLNKKYGSVDYKILAAAILEYRRVNTGLLSPYSGAKDLLNKLKKKGYKLGILSDAPKLEAYLRLTAVEFIDLFDAIITKDDVKAIKPDSKGFLAIAKELKVDIKECIMVGDNDSRDIKGAKALGMKTIFAKYGDVHDTKKINADYVAEKPVDILKFI